MNVLLVAVLLAVCVLRSAKAVVTVTFDGELKTCESGKQRVGWDLSSLDILMMDNENITLDGKFAFTADYYSPLFAKVTLKRLVDKISKTWAVMAVRVIPNFCDVVNFPNEMWSGVMSQMEHRSCPFLAGHSETFDKANIGNLAKSLKISPQLLGPWKIFIEIGTKRGGVSVTECTMADLMLEDV
ncbi:conserved hypothetical protein [Culex quinquefasciatus]|uniref:Uncharacterized protein n=1 Tax=Culex quinquefasciatus TaxID=7176 RepID=B0W4U8_CULQU|nr:uncharacterized protein LOC6033258 [Culex quinquefasciatus]EDS34286.1 conserved hypothetical protein [Culex quinquefasciatus]|eukprot:XP_001843732.1 conserved hypothetical protein [Culex quinquefasciatus]